VLGALGVRLVLWDRAYGFEQGDPVEYVNIAYRIAFGVGIEWWDLRPLLLSLLYVPIMVLMQWWPDPTGEAMVRALRLVGVAFGVGSVWLTYGIGRLLGGFAVGLVGGLVVALNPVINRLTPTTFAEVPSTFFVLLAAWLLLRARAADDASDGRTVSPALPTSTGPRPAVAVGRHNRPRSWAPLLASAATGAGAALGIGCMIRYQAIAYLAPFGIWVLATDLWRIPPDRWLPTLLSPRSLTLRFGVGLAVATAIQALIELVAYGRPFHSLLVSFQYNVTSGLAPVEFGAEPFDWFLRQTPSWFGLLPALLALVGLVRLVRGPRAAGWRLVGLAAATMLLVLSVLPHKEERFMTQVIPLLAPFVGAGVALLAATAARLGAPAPVGATFAGLLAAAVSVPLLVASWTLDVRENAAYVDGAKRAADLKPDGVLGTIPWFVPRPYTGARLALERMDRNVWSDRERVARAIEASDFILIPEYWLLEDRDVDRLVSAGFRSIESYENGVALYQSRRLDEPLRRRPRS